ncbi:GNAT family N-acetyltransferase [Celerinatantimonas sp. YJH-8]|uniref:GNAT family N-acetyltransferase n=1 Tax=Celerinatantimonas sp. YJH-8 TaxID=3228714 RepID=UPI0038CB53E2
MKRPVLTDIQLRVMQPQDLPLSFNIYISTRLDEMQLSGWSDQEIHQFLDAQAQTQHHYYMQHYQQAKYYIIEYAQHDVGRLYIDDLGPEIRIVDIALLPDFRNLGIGTTLIRQLQQQGQRQHLDVSIHVEQNNPAMRLYQRLGFELVEKVNGIYHFMRWKYPQTMETPV